jgi:hypothetical protein
VHEQDASDGPDGAGSDWSLTAVQATGLAHRRESLLGYERALLDAVTGGQTTSSLAARMPKILAEARREILQDAVHRGWLRHIHHDQRTAEGDQLAARIQTFHRRLRQYASSQSQDGLAGPLLPYAMHFGLVDDTDMPLFRFARYWVRTFSVLPGWHQEHSAFQEALLVHEGPSIIPSAYDSRVGRPVIASQSGKQLSAVTILDRP